MASREKRPLAPPKTKQKLNDDTGLSSPTSKNKKGKTLPSYILGSVATGSKLTNKLESSLKKKLRAAKGNLIKVKATKNVPVKTLKRLGTQKNNNKGTKSTLSRTKRTKPVDREAIVTSDSGEKCTSKTSIKFKLNIPSTKSGKIPARKKGEGAGKYLKRIKEHQKSIDTTIDEVLAMVSDTENPDTSAEMEKIEGKVTRSRRGGNLIDGKTLLTEVEVKKELIEAVEGGGGGDDDDSSDVQETKKGSSRRSLRNGKMRQLETMGNDSEMKKNRRGNSEGSANSEMINENISESLMADESNLSQSSNVENIPGTIAIVKEESSRLDDSLNSLIELENNNNGGGNVEGGPILRSKTKAKSTDTQVKIEDCETDDSRSPGVIIIDDPKKSGNLDQLRKDNLLSKFSGDKQPAKRRASLNIDVKKTIGSMYGNEKTDKGTPKSQIDQMIENIKLTIAKSIENKIFGPEKALGLGKNFDLPKTEEIIAPLSSESQIIGLDDEAVDNEEPNVSKKESSNSAGENSVPKVADTAKEIEKLVMGDIEPNSIEKRDSNTETSTKEEINEEESTSKNQSCLIEESNNPETIEKSEDLKVEEIDNSEVHNSEENTPIELSENQQQPPPPPPIPQISESQSGDVETLESITREVEQLVAGTEEIRDSEIPIESEETLKNDKMVEIEENEVMDATETTSVEPELSSMKITEEIHPIETPEISITEKIIEKNEEKCENEEIPMEEESKSPVKEEHEKVESSPESTKLNTSEENKVIEEGRRVLRTRDKQKKTRSTELTEIESVKIEPEEDKIVPELDLQKSIKTPETVITIKIEEPEPQIRTRRCRDVKRRREETAVIQNNLKSKRHRRETRKTEQNKEETLLDNEVAKINENKRSYSSEKFSKRLEGTESLGVFSEEDRGNVDKENNSKTNRSKSENDIESVKNKSDGTERLSSNQRCESNETKVSSEIHKEDSDIIVKTPVNLQKDSDGASTSGESTNSREFLETPEDKARKESILRMLGLESLERAAERLHHQKAKKEQYTGTLKTVIRVQKDRDREKKGSRSPLKMVLKQGRTDGEGDSPEFYTIQKELGTSGLGDSSSGANRKFSTNHRQSCDEDNNEETPSKDRQSLIIPEKSSSFSIHPGRLCADVCCYCFGKFGSLDTPMHLAQHKSDERRKKILSIERHLTKDSCLCDACYRHVDRKANTSPTNVGSKPPRQHRQLMVAKCSARDCRAQARHLVKRRWLLKIKSCLQNHVTIDWEPSQHTSMSFCVDHYDKIGRFLTCALCKRRLARNHTHLLTAIETEELNQLLPQRGIPVPLTGGTFVCKLCRYYTQLTLKYKDMENMSTNHRLFAKNYRKQILQHNDIDVEEDDDEGSSQSASNKDKDKRNKKLKLNKSSNSSKSPEMSLKSEKSTVEETPNVDEANSGTDNESSIQERPKDDIETNEQILDLESTVEKLKKRKALDQHLYSTESPSFENSNDIVEILAMDKEVTLTRLPKKPRMNNDITPVVQRLGANPSISVRTLFPGEEEMGLHANVEFSNVRGVTPQGWEKCATVIQYDRDTKILWQELQRPYGNQSSFLRHLILLEKYYRSGDLVLAPNASRNAINYSTSVQNRLISYEGPEKMDEPITEPISAEFNNPRRLSGGFMMERDRLSMPSTSSSLLSNVAATSTPAKTNISIQQQGVTPKSIATRILKMTPGVSIIKKPPPNLQRLSAPPSSSATSSSSSSSSSTANGSAKRKDGFPSKITGSTSGGKVFQLSEPAFKRLQSLKKQKMLNEKMLTPTGNAIVTAANLKTNTMQYQKAQIAAQTEFQRHLRMQQEMLNRQSRGDFEPLICDVRALVNENTPAQNLLNNLNLPKSIQVTTKPSNPIPILPKIPKSLTVIPQTVPRPVEK